MTTRRSFQPDDGVSLLRASWVEGGGGVARKPVSPPVKNRDLDPPPLTSPKGCRKSAVAKDRAGRKGGALRRAGWGQRCWRGSARNKQVPLVKIGTSRTPPTSHQHRVPLACWTRGFFIAGTGGGIGT